MTLRADIAILLLLLYSLVLGLSNSLHVSFALPLLPEFYRNKNHIFTIFKKLVLLNLFISIIAITVYFSDSRLALLIYLRSNMVVLFALLLFHDCNYFTIAYGLQKLKCPNFIVSIFYFNGKFIHILLQSIKTFKNNLIIRGFEPKINLFTYKTYANFVGLLFIQAFYRANTLKNILITRGYTGEIFTLENTKKLNKYELMLSFVTLISLIIGVIF